MENKDLESKEEKIKKLIQRKIDLCLQEAKELHRPKLKDFDYQISYEHALEDYYTKTGLITARIVMLSSVLKEIETL